jgi:hypothetical protein
MHELLQREQQASESVEDYIHNMRQLASRLRKPMAERHLVKIIKKGFRENIARFVYAMDILTVDELRDESKEVERNFGRRGRAAYTQQPAYPNFKARVHEVSEPPPEEPPTQEVEELRKEPLKKPERMGCWNCGTVGHLFRDCESAERRLFCYRCGKPGTVSPKCPDCAGNDRRAAPRAGEARPK